jgi:hypothetical protein
MYHLLGVNYDYEDSITGNPVCPTIHWPPRDYIVDHSANFYVLDDLTRLLTWLVEPPHASTCAASLLKGIMKHYGGW